MHRIPRRRILKVKPEERTLYGVIERDLLRGAIFPYHDGWCPQVRTERDKRIDYLIYYGSKNIGIEVKRTYPIYAHFDQLRRYQNYCDVLFLAYPSDLVGEYFNLMKSDPKNRLKDIGVISIGVIQSYILKKAKYRCKRKDFPDEKENFPKSQREWTEFLRFLNLISQEDWKRIALFYMLFRAYGDRYFTQGEAWKKFQEVKTTLGWSIGDYWSDSFTFRSMTEFYPIGIDYYYRFYYIYNDNFERTLRTRIRKSIGSREWTKLIEISEKWKKDFGNLQKEHQGEFIG
jgi:hypothetical protein